MARKATAVEAAVLDVFRQISFATPAIHKETKRRHGVSAPTSPWVHVYRLGCELLLAVEELGRRCRHAAGDSEPGPICRAMSDRALERLRDKYQRGLRGRTLEESDRCHTAAIAARKNLPFSGDPCTELAWAMSRLYDPFPDFETAPSQLAISTWLVAESTNPGATADSLLFLMKLYLRLGRQKAAKGRRGRRNCRELTDEESSKSVMEEWYGPHASWRAPHTAPQATYSRR